MQFSGKVHRNGPSTWTRREFVGASFAAGAGALAARHGQVLGDDLPAARRGGGLRIAATGGGVADSLNPATISDYSTFLANWAIRNCLVEVDAHGNAIPELAESWDASADAKKWVFKLRRGVEFHNGKVLTAADVVWSVNHHRGARSNSAVRGLVEMIEDVATDGSSSVVFVLKDGNVDFPYLLSDPHLVICPNGTQGPDWDIGVGTAGYVLRRWELGIRFFCTRNPNYWKTGRAHFDEVEILNVADVAARSNALRSGAVDVIVNPDLKIVSRLGSIPGLRIVETASNGHISIPMLTDTPPFDNPDVRMALKFAIDRNAFVETILHGHGTPGNDQPINSTYRYYANDLPQRHYDPDRAKYHLRRSGHTHLTVSLSTALTPFDGAVDAASLFAEQAAAAGIRINVVREANDAYWTRVWMKRPLCMSHWNGRSTEDWIFSLVYAAGASWNETRWNLERFNVLLRTARTERDEAKRRQMYREMQLLISDDGGVIIPAFDHYIMGASSRLSHGALAGNWNLDGYRLPERWWFG